MRGGGLKITIKGQPRQKPQDPTCEINKSKNAKGVDQVEHLPTK
jgi:hypothetical protein